MKFGAIYINDSRKYIPGVDDPREELASGREGEERHEGGLDGEDDEAGVDQPQVEVHPDGLAHQLGLAQDGQALRDRALPGGGSQAANTGPAAGEREVEEPLPEGGVRLLGDLPAAVAVRVQVVHHLPHVGVHVPEQTGCLLAAPESPDDPAEVGERDGDAHQQREGRHQVNLVHRRRVMVLVEVEPVSVDEERRADLVPGERFNTETFGLCFGLKNGLRFRFDADTCLN